MVRIMMAALTALLLSSGVAWADEKQGAATNEAYEMDSWSSAKGIDTIEAYEVYLAEYANGRHAKFAQAAINKLRKAEGQKTAESGSPVKTEVEAPVKAGADAAIKVPAAEPVVAAAVTQVAVEAQAAPAAETKTPTQPAPTESAVGADAAKKDEHAAQP